MYQFNTCRDPYNSGFNTCSSRQVTLEEGLTVLVGCNGSGKTTLIQNIKNCLKKDNIPYYDFDNLNEGGSRASGDAIAMGDFAFGATAWCSSEGENITLNLTKIMGNMREFILTGETPKSKRSKRLHSLFHDDDEEAAEICNKRFVIMDAVDSGYSIDNVIELKDLLHMIINDAKNNGIELYIIVSANEYELAANEACLDVTNGKYLRFDNYESFRSFIIKSRKKKNARDEKAKTKRQNSRKETK